MRVLIAENDYPLYARLLQQAAPDLQVQTSGDSAQLAKMAAECPVWLGQPDLLATLLRQGHKPQWLQSTWAGITPLLAEGLTRDYRLTRAVGIFGQVMAEYVLTYMLGHEREVMARLVSQVERKWDNRMGQSLVGRKVLIVGAGDIGQTVAQFLLPFGVELYAIASSAREQEPLPSKHPFWTAWGLLLTGHSSAPTSPPLMVQLFVDNLRAYQAGQPLRGEVDFDRGY